MRHEHKSGAFFELPEDISQMQLELYEAEVRRVLGEAEKPELMTDALLARASLQGAFKADFISASEGLPMKNKEISETSARLLWWMARLIAEFIAELKTIDPKE